MECGDVEEADSVVPSGDASSDVGTTVYLARGILYEEAHGS